MMTRLSIALTLPFVALMATLNLVHPLFHAFEGGMVDSVIDYLTALAAQMASTLQPRRV